MGKLTPGYVHVHILILYFLTNGCGMQPHLYKQLSIIEDVVWWHKARSETVFRIVSRLGLTKNAVALDVGCGTGGAFGLFKLLGIDRGVGFDLAWDGVRIARDKWQDYSVIQADASKEFPFVTKVISSVIVARSTRCSLFSSNNSLRVEQPTRFIFLFTVTPISSAFSCP